MSDDEARRRKKKALKKAMKKVRRAVRNYVPGDRNRVVIL